MYRIIISLFACAGLTILAAGCWNNVDSAQQACPAYSNIPYGAAFDKAFTGCVWKTIPDEGKKKQVQFEGKISFELHAFAIGKLNRTPNVDLFSQACAYLGMLIKNGKTAGDPFINFDTAGYPINSDGSVKTDQLGVYLDDPENRKAVIALEDFYRKRFWEENSPVSIVFTVTGIKKAEPVKSSNPFWDIDPKFAGKTGDVVAIIYEYIKPLLTVE